MRRTLLALTFLAGIVAGCGQSSSKGTATAPPGGQPVTTAQVPAPTGGSNELFGSHCGKCHSLAAAGSEPMKKAPNLAKAGADAAHTAEWLADHIRNPKSHKPESKMPAFENKLKPEEIKALGEYLAGLK